MRVRIEGIATERPAQWRRYVAETIARALYRQGSRCRRATVRITQDGSRTHCALEVELAGERSAEASGRGHTATEAIEMAANALSVSLLPRNDGAFQRAA